VEIVKAHPFLGPRYGDSLEHLAAALLRVLGSDGVGAITFEDATGDSVVPLGSSIATFVSADFVRELKTPPSFWVGQELVRRILRGDSPILSDRQVREANSKGGLNLVVWQTGVLPDYIKLPGVGNASVTSFIELYRGYLLTEVIAQAESVEHLCGMLNVGVLYFDAHDGGYKDLPEGAADQVAAAPHIVGLTREHALNFLGSWVGSLFLYRPLRCGFSRSEQELLSSALAGGTDEELSRKLRVSHSYVKKTWRAIYQRAAAAAPECIADKVYEDGMPSERGKEKKHHLLPYVREHPEELRPVSRRILQRDTPGRSPSTLPAL
jgi:hypothetical protein